MVINGVVYSLGDWIAQCYEGKPLFEFDRSRMFRSGIVGFSLHGSLCHYYYQICEALFPFQDWWVVPAKVVFDQTVWAAVWNSIYYVLLGFLRFESPANILGELKATFWPMLTNMAQRKEWMTRCLHLDVRCIKSIRSLPRRLKVNCIVFDKTGTLAVGKPVVVNTRLLKNMVVRDFYELLAATEDGYNGC